MKIYSSKNQLTAIRKNPKIKMFMVEKYANELHNREISRRLIATLRFLMIQGISKESLHLFSQLRERIES